MTHQFKLRPDGFKELKKAMLLRTIPVAIIAATTGLLIVAFNTATADPMVYTISGIIGGVCMSLGLAMAVRLQKGMYESYRLTIDENAVTREQKNTPTLSIPRSGVKQITKSSKGHFIIKGSNSLNQIIIMAQIEEPETLEALLNEIRPVTVKRQKAAQLLLIPAVILTLGSFFSVATSANKVLVSIGGGVLLIVFVCSGFIFLKSKNVDATTRRKMWWLLPVFFALCYTVYSKLTQ